MKTNLSMFTFIIAIICCIIYLLVQHSNYKKGFHSKKSYEELLQTKEWKEKRDSIIKRDNYKCVFCGSPYNLQVHHKYYSKYPNNRFVDPWNYPDDALITLCDNCHHKVHNKNNIKVYYRRYFDNY